MSRSVDSSSGDDLGDTGMELVQGCSEVDIPITEMFIRFKADLATRVMHSVGDDRLIRLPQEAEFLYKKIYDVIASYKARILFEAVNTDASGLKWRFKYLSACAHKKFQGRNALFGSLCLKFESVYQPSTKEPLSAVLKAVEFIIDGVFSEYFPGIDNFELTSATCRVPKEFMLVFDDTLHFE